MAKAKMTKDDLLASIMKRIESARNAAGVWEQNQDKWHRLRMRVKKPKSFPFEGCSNIRMPTAEKVIRKYKAGVLSSFFSLRPIVQVVPGPNGSFEQAQKIEKLIDHICMDIMDGFEEKTSILLDNTCEKGFALAKTFWDREIIDRKLTLTPASIGEEKYMILLSFPEVPDELVMECIKAQGVDESELVFSDNFDALKAGLEELRIGKPETKVSVKDVVKNCPDIAVVSPERCYVPTNSGIFVQGLDFVCQEFFQSLRTLKTNAKDGVGKGWDKKAVADIDEYQYNNLDDKKVDLTKDEREGVERLQKPNQSVRLWEVYGWFDINGDGEEEKALLTIAPDFKKIIRKVEIPLDSGKYPFVRFSMEYLDDRWFSSRGIPEVLEDIIKEIDTQHNQKIDQQTIRNAPMFVYRSGMVNPNLVQFIPSQGIPVKGTQNLRDTIDVLNNNNPNVEYSYEREALLLNTEIQEIFAQADFSIQSIINKREPRTLGEVDLQQRSLGGQFSLDVRLHGRAFSELLTQIFEFWNQFGPTEYAFNYFGPNSVPEQVKLTKEDLQGKFTITVRGNDQNTNPNTRVQKAQFILQGVTNPVLIQMGVVTPMQAAAAWKRALQEADIKEWEQFSVPMPQPVNQTASVVPPNFDSLTDAEQAQVLQKAGIDPDMVGRMLKKQAELENMNGKKPK